MNGDKCVLVTGGAGYVGSHVIVELVLAGYTVVMFDLSQHDVTDCVENVKAITGKTVHGYALDLLDTTALDELFKQHQIYCVVHLAGLKAARESHSVPLQYYRVNVLGSVNLFQVMENHQVFNLIFSSSSKVYGTPEYLPLDEKHQIGSCTNPYGRTKYMVEEIIKDICQSNMHWNVTVLRYFNPCGAHPSGRLGESRTNGAPRNIMPAVCQAAQGRLKAITIFGNDYNTADGTAVKDYTHVVDLSQGHIAALRKFDTQKGYKVYNLGMGQQHSVLDMVHIFEKISGRTIPVNISERKPGEIGVCFADSSLAERELGWKANKSLEQMCEDLWNFEENNTNKPASEGIPNETLPS